MCVSVYRCSRQCKSRKSRSSVFFRHSPYFNTLLLLSLLLGMPHVCRSEDSFQESVPSSHLSVDSTISPPSCNKGLHQSKPSSHWPLHLYVLRQGLSPPEGLTILAGLDPLTWSGWQVHTTMLGFTWEVGIRTQVICTCALLSEPSPQPLLSPFLSLYILRVGLM